MNIRHDVTADGHPRISAGSWWPDPTRGFFIPGLKAVAVACQVLAGLQLLKHLEAAPVLVGAVQMAPVVTAIAWTVRYRTRSQRVRAVCSLVAFVSAAASTSVGTLGFGAPTLMVAVALLVVDLSLKAGLIANLIFVGAASIVTLMLDRDPLEVALVGINFLVFLGSGILLGLVLARYDAVLTDLRQTLAERDAALGRAERQAAVEKELMLAEERARAAHELHDGLGHRLTQIGMSLEFAARVRERDPEAAWQEVAVAERTSREAVGEMRTWVRALSPAHPSVLQASGEKSAGAANLTDAVGAAGLDVVAASFRGTGVQVDVMDEVGPGVLTQEAELLVHRAVQEGLTNALRHSGARVITIHLTSAADEARENSARPSHIELTVTNPIPAERREAIPIPAVGQSGGPTPGFGVGGLAQRAAELGGTATAGRDGDAFRLCLTLPASTALHAAHEEVA